MRRLLVLPFLLVASPALAQFPPPGVYACEDAAGIKLGTLSLLVAGDYQWEANEQTYVGQVASSGSGVEALSGPLAEAKWHGSFVTQMDQTMFVFDTASGQVICK